MIKNKRTKKDQLYVGKEKKLPFENVEIDWLKREQIWNFKMWWSKDWECENRKRLMEWK